VQIISFCTTPQALPPFFGAGKSLHGEAMKY